MNILVVHRIHLFADALAANLRQVAGVRFVEVAYGAEQCMVALECRRFDVVILTRSGMERCLRMRRSPQDRAHPGTKVVVASADRNPGLVAEVERAGMDGIVQLNQSAEGLVAELAQVVAGRHRLHTNHVRPRPASGSLCESAPCIACHDEVDVEIVRLVSTGLCDKEIASRIFLSPQTVRNRLSRILRESTLDNRTQLAAVFLRHEIHANLA